MQIKERDKIMRDFQQTIDRCFIFKPGITVSFLNHHRGNIYYSMTAAKLRKELEYRGVRFEKNESKDVMVKRLKTNDDEKVIRVELSSENDSLLAQVYDMDKRFFYFKVEKFSYTALDDEILEEIRRFPKGIFCYEFENKCTVSITNHDDNKVFSWNAFCLNPEYFPAKMMFETPLYLGDAISRTKLNDEMDQILKSAYNVRCTKLAGLLSELSLGGIDPEDRQKRRKEWKRLVINGAFMEEYSPEDGEIDIRYFESWKQWKKLAINGAFMEKYSPEDVEFDMHYFDLWKQKSVKKSADGKSVNGSIKYIYSIDLYELDQVEEHIENLDTFLRTLQAAYVYTDDEVQDYIPEKNDRMSEQEQQAQQEAYIEHRKRLSPKHPHPNTVFRSEHAQKYLQLFYLLQDIQSIIQNQDTTLKSFIRKVRPIDETPYIKALHKHFEDPKPYKYKSTQAEKITPERSTPERSTPEQSTRERSTRERSRKSTRIEAEKHRNTDESTNKRSPKSPRIEQAKHKNTDEKYRKMNVETLRKQLRQYHTEFKNTDRKEVLIQKLKATLNH